MSSYKRISKKDAVAGRALSSFLLSAGYYPQIYEGEPQEFSNVSYKNSGPGVKNKRFINVSGPNVFGIGPGAKVEPHGKWALSGNQVWYQFGGSKAQRGQRELDKAVNTEPILAKMMGVGARNYAPALSSIRKIRQPKQERKFFAHLMNIFQRNSAAESGNFLTTLNKQFKEEVASSIGEKVPSDTTTEQIETTPGSLMSEEQVKVLEEGRDQTKGIGLTQPIDTRYFKVAGNIYIDVSEMTVEAGGHHGLGPSGIKSLSGKLDNIKEKDFKMIKNEVYKHFQERIPMFNEGIRRIREAARTTKYGKNSGRVTPEEMRRAGFSTSDTFVHPKVGKRDALNYRRYKTKTLDNASASASAVINKLGFDAGKRKVDKSATAFILHALGTFNEHQGNYYHGLTVSHNPHVTTSVNFRQFSANAKQRAYEYKKLRKDKDVIVSYGYASLEILRRKNILKSGMYVNTVRKQKNVHHGARYMRGAKQITVGGYQSVGVRRGAGRKIKQTVTNTETGKKHKLESEAGIASCAIHIPTGWSDKFLARAVAYLQEDNFRPAKQGTNKFKHSIQDKINMEENKALQRGYGGYTPHWPRNLSFWATPYYGYSSAYGEDTS